MDKVVLTESERKEVDLLMEEFNAKGGMSTEELISRLDTIPWTCPICGTNHDRDLNAAMNILMEGNRIMGNEVPNLINQIGVRSTEFTLVEKPTVDDRTICS